MRLYVGMHMLAWALASNVLNMSHGKSKFLDCKLLGICSSCQGIQKGPNFRGKGPMFSPAVCGEASL